MCGRYSLSTPADHIAELLHAESAVELRPRYNIAPTQEAPIVRPGNRSGARRRLALARWGLVPWWADDPSIGSRMINARSETAAGKRAFREAFERRRCLVPADGFYEWRRAGGVRQPYYFRPADAPFLTFAGLWERWRGPRGGALESFTILTTGANPAVAPVHDRMPVILEAAERRRWLDPAAEPGRLAELLRPFAGELAAFPVSRFVNSPANDSPRCVEPLAEPPPDPAPMLW